MDILQDDKVHTVRLGETFKKNCTSAFHTVRLDFKPASVDINQTGRVEVTDKHQVEIELPHQKGSKNASTVYKGSTKPVQKECILIIDPETGSITLERITSQIQVKKIRLASDQKLTQPTNVQPIKPPVKQNTSKKTLPPKTKPPSPVLFQSNPLPQTSKDQIEEDVKADLGKIELMEDGDVSFSNVQKLITKETLSSSDDDDSDSDSDSSSSSSPSSSEVTEQVTASLGEENLLENDLHLSSSDSD